MGGVCVVVADAAHARFFTAEAGAGPRAPRVLTDRGSLENPDLRERGESVTGRPRTETNTDRQAGPVHPMGAQRERHRVELTRRFAAEIAERAAEIIATRQSATLMLIAEPRMLGMLREMSGRAVRAGIEIKELAKDFGGLTQAEIQHRLFENGLEG